MSQAPEVRARSPVAGNVPPSVQPFAHAAAARLLIDVRHTRHESVEFPDNLFFNDLCGQIVREEAILLAGAPGSSLTERWIASDYGAKRQILEMVCLNFSLDGATLVPEWRKPFDVLAKGLLVSSSRGDRTPIELFVEHAVAAYRLRGSHFQPFVSQIASAHSAADLGTSKFAETPQV